MDLTVERLSPTFWNFNVRATDLNTIERDGPTDLNSIFFVNNASPTKLTGYYKWMVLPTLMAFNKTTQAPTLLTGTLTVNKIPLFNQQADTTEAAHEKRKYTKTPTTFLSR
jgi:hypothetical protein